MINELRQQGFAPAGCRYCWSPFGKACTDAHLHGCRYNTVRLCWICNRAYDHDLFDTRALLKAEGLFHQTPGPSCRMSELSDKWAKGVASGELHWNTKMHRDKLYRRDMALSRKEIAPYPSVPGDEFAYYSILPRSVPWEPPNVDGIIAALKAHRSRQRELLGLAHHPAERDSIQSRIDDYDRRIAGAQALLQKSDLLQHDLHNLWK
jgi:hypothetical protein